MKFDALAAYAVVFGKSIAELCPERFAEIEERIVRSANALFREWQASDYPAALRKRELLTLLLKRAITRLHRHDA